LPPQWRDPRISSLMHLRRHTGHISNTPLPTRLIQQQTPSHRSIQTLHRSGAGNRHPRIAHLHPLRRQPTSFIPNHHRASRSKIHLLRRNHTGIIRPHSSNQPNPTPLQLRNLRSRHSNHRHTKHAPHTSSQRLLVPRTHRPRRSQNTPSPKRLRRPHQRPQIPRILHARSNQNQSRPPALKQIRQSPHRRHHQSRDPLRRLRLHHTPKHFIRQPQHLHPTRHNPRHRSPLTHKHTLQNHPTPQSLLQQMVPLNRDHPATQSRMALKRRSQLLHPRIRSARNHQLRSLHLPKSYAVSCPSPAPLSLSSQRRYAKVRDCGNRSRPGRTNRHRSKI
jgi:hypothetical protein